MSDSKNNPTTANSENNRRRNTVIAFLAILLIVTSSIAIRTMKEAPIAQPNGGNTQMSMPPAAVFVQPLVREITQPKASVTGTLHAISEARVAAREPGAVVEVLASEGDIVSKNDVVAKLDTSRVESLLAEAKARLASSKALAEHRTAEFERAKTDLTMKRGLLTSKAVSQSDVFDAERALLVAKAQRNMANDGIVEMESRIQFLEIQLKDLSIVAPFDGVITASEIEPGEWVNAGTVAASIVTIDPIEAWLRVPARYLNSLDAESDKFRIHQSTTGRFYEPASIKIVPQIDPMSQLFTVIATLPNPQGKLAPGESVTGIVPAGKQKAYWRIATDAIIRAASGDFIYIVEQADNPGGLPKAKRVPVNVQFEREENTYIPAASVELSDNDQVIVEGNERLFPGQPIMIKPKETVAAHKL